MATATTTSRFSLVKKLLLVTMLAAAARIVRTLAPTPSVPSLGLSHLKDASDSSIQVVRIGFISNTGMIAMQSNSPGVKVRGFVNISEASLLRSSLRANRHFWFETFKHKNANIGGDHY